MTTYFNRTIEEQELIRKAYEFEVEAIRRNSAERNPFFNAVLSMDDGEEVWKNINFAVEMAFN